MKHRKPDKYGEYMKHVINRINEINEWRGEAIKHAISPEHRAAVDARVLELRENVERSL